MNRRALSAASCLDFCSKAWNSVQEALSQPLLMSIGFMIFWVVTIRLLLLPHYYNYYHKLSFPHLYQ